ncbi:MAG: hypothetical protein K1Y02_25915 [Candidatus Hydrogenedentes bacterium]|nr:hypothetical protein [Candidatus Hydrogenedentota bacterium]
MRYRNKLLAAAALAAAALATTPAGAGTNLLQNASFETQGSGSDETAYRWNYNNPDTHGGIWGTFSRRGWRSHSGSWEGALQGSWINRGPDGGAWQEGPAIPGGLYEASAWFWADVPGTGSGGPWTSLVQELKIEFYSTNFGSAIMTYQTNLGVITESWTQKTLRATAPFDAAWARWVVAVVGVGSKGALQFDDAELRLITPRSQDFNDWTSQTNDNTHVRDDWILSTGKTQTADSRSGYCANLGNAGTVSNSGHFLRSVAFSNGVGTVSFWYRHATGTNALTYEVQVSPDGTNWSVRGGITNFLGTNYLRFTKYIYEPGMQYARIYHTSGAGRLLVDDVTVDEPSTIQRYVDFDDWPNSYTTFSCYSYAGWELCTGRINVADADAGQSAQILGSTSGGNYLLSPLFVDGVGEINFSYRATTNTSALAFSIQTSTNGSSWNTAAIYTNITNTAYADASQYIYVTNAAYVRIRHEGSSTSNSLLVDSVDVDTPYLYRSQNFDTWPSKNAYTNATFQGWRVFDAKIYDSITRTNVPLSGNVAVLDDTVSAHAYLQSPYFPDGVGSISFSYLVDDATPPGNIRYQILTSTDSVTWVTNDTITGITNNDNFAQYSQYLYLTNGLYVRVYHTSGASRVVFDSISVAPPSPPADVTMNGYITPTQPWTSNTVYVNSDIQTFYGAAVTNLSAFYRIGTSGAFTALGMQFSNGVTYASTSAIPAQTAGTRVQYYVRCDFAGPASISNSPRYYPSTGSNSPASYSIPRAQSGQVWINEINYVSDFIDDTQEFVEVCGPSGFDLSGWQVDLVQGGTTNGTFYSYGLYTIPNGVVLSNDSNGHGFYVLGDLELTARDQSLTYTNPVDFSQIADGYDPSGVKLYNEAGGLEQFISYEGTLILATQIAAKEDYPASQDPNSIQLTGTGSTFGVFAWTTNTMTPGAANFGQSFPPTGPAAPPTVYLASMVLGTNIVMTFTGNSNNWIVQPYLTTNLTSPQTWQAVTPYNSSTNSVWFDRPTSWWYYIFRLNLTN